MGRRGQQPTPREPQPHASAGPRGEASKPKSCPHTTQPEGAEGMNNQPENWDRQFKEQDKPGERVKETHSFRFRIDFPRVSPRLAEHFLAGPKCLPGRRGEGGGTQAEAGILSEVLHIAGPRRSALGSTATLGSVVCNCG